MISVAIIKKYFLNENLHMSQNILFYKNTASNFNERENR